MAFKIQNRNVLISVTLVILIVVGMLLLATLNIRLEHQIYGIGAPRIYYDYGDNNYKNDLIFLSIDFTPIFYLTMYCSMLVFTVWGYLKTRFKINWFSVTLYIFISIPAIIGNFIFEDIKYAFLRGTNSMLILIFICSLLIQFGFTVYVFLELMRKMKYKVVE
jgi:hypothetical protein